jgi:hypothetical protein
VLISAHFLAVRTYYSTEFTVTSIICRHIISFGRRNKLNVIALRYYHLCNTQDLSSFYLFPPTETIKTAHEWDAWIWDLFVHICSCMLYLYFVTRTWRKSDIKSLPNSAPRQSLMPPPNGMKFLCCVLRFVSSCVCMQLAPDRSCKLSAFWVKHNLWSKFNSSN